MKPASLKKLLKDNANTDKSLPISFGPPRKLDTQSGLRGTVYKSRAPPMA